MTRTSCVLFCLLLTLAASSSSLALPPSITWGSALSYGGGDQTTHLGYSLSQTDNITLEGWVKWTYSTNNMVIFYSGASYGNGFGLAIEGSTSDVCLLLGGLAWVTTGVDLTANVTHLVLTRDGGVWHVYVNGVEVLNHTTNPNAPSGDFYVGGDPHNGGFLGSIDEVRFSSTVRYTSNFSPPTAPFTSDASTIALFHFDEGSGTAANEATGSTGSLTLIGTTLPVWISSAVPVELTSFTAAAGRGYATLHWTTASEVMNHGFELERRLVAGAEWTRVAFIPGYGTTNDSHTYSFTDKTFPGSYAYRLRQIDQGGAFVHSQEVTVDILPPAAAILSQNYPDPFNPSTSIDYTLPLHSWVTIKVFDLSGREVTTLVEGMRGPGTHRATWNAQGQPSGTYVCRMTSGEGSAVRRLVLIR